MNAMTKIAPASDIDRALVDKLAVQRAAFLRDGPPSLAQRLADLKKLKDAILARENEFARALDQDFGHRSKEETLLLDVASTIATINYLSSNLARFMRPERRRTAMIFSSGRNRVVYQPLGVVGIVSPWNYPVGLALNPLATAIAAGNRVMLKPSEFVPATTALTASMLADIFAEEQVAVVQGDAKVGAAFTRLPFDHLLFTGSTQVGRAVMRAASDNLVPVTLELGGKSPVIVERGYDLATAAKRVAYGKLLNAGQTCVAPDYVLVPKEEVEAFATAFKDAAATLYPDIATNPNYTWIVNDHHFARLSGLLEDAKAKGARVIDVGGTRASGEQPQSRMFLPALVLGATGEMSVMQEEIFGPILPVVPYADLEEAVAFVNARPRPLALYFFGPNGPGRKLVLEHTTSGNVAINETMLHYAQEDLPFGGVGQSGMGLYHGREGFKSMSHAKGVFAQGPISFADLIRPPYGRVFDFLLRWNMR